MTTVTRSSTLGDMAYARGRSDARAGFDRYPRSQHPEQYSDYNAGWHDWHKLHKAPATPPPYRPQDNLDYLRATAPSDLATLALDANPLAIPPMVQALAEALQAELDGRLAPAECPTCGCEL